MYDIIGDIHGYADALDKLLMSMGYKKNAGSYTHPSRKVIFLGDYIDRGPGIRKTLHIVRNMHENGYAHAIMGNHEYNAICYATRNQNGKSHLRRHSFVNYMQHADTLFSFFLKKKEYKSFISWMKTLPLFFETEGMRAIHASWIHHHIDYIKENLPENKLSPNFLEKSVKQDTSENNIVQDILKGIEIDLPKGLYMRGRDGLYRNKFRVKWWEGAYDKTYQEMSVHDGKKLPNTKIPDKDLKSIDFYKETEPPVFFGHYWFYGKPSVIRSNICCLDFSIAKNGKLVAYRWDGESQLTNKKLFYL